MLPILHNNFNNLRDKVEKRIEKEIWVLKNTNHIFYVKYMGNKPIHIDFTFIKYAFFGMTFAIVALFSLAIYSFNNNDYENDYTDLKERQKHLMEFEDTKVVSNVDDKKMTYRNKVNRLLNVFYDEHNIIHPSHIDLKNKENLESLKILHEQIAIYFIEEVLEKQNKYINNRNVREFLTVDKINAALMEKIKYNIPPSIILAQAAQESSWGSSKLSLEANNYFGIKYKDGDVGEYYLISTDEIITDKTYQKIKKSKKFEGKEFIYIKREGNNHRISLVNEKFKKYPTWWHSFRDHSIFLIHNDRYAKLFQRGGGNFRKWTETFRPAKYGGVPYATDTEYGKKMENIIISYKLYLLDF